MSGVATDANAFASEAQIAEFKQAYRLALAWLADVPVDANDAARTIHKNFTMARTTHEFMEQAGSPTGDALVSATRVCDRATMAANRWIAAQPPVRALDVILALPGRVLLATQAPDSYDGGFTFTVLTHDRGFVPCARTDARDAGKYRVVSVDAEYADWQRGRYLSGCYGADTVTAEAVKAHAG